jgi:hypothetical protein
MQRVAALTFVLALSLTLSVAAGDGADYGDGVAIEKATPVETLLSSPDDYIGKTVRVDGVITGACKKRGCWIQVTNPDTGDGIRIKVDDGVIVFPYTSMGKRASAEGVFDAITLTPEQVEAQAAKKAAEHGHEPGEDCDDASKEGKRNEDAGCGADVTDNRIFLIRGTGAVIYD